MSVDDAVRAVTRLGRGAMLAKLDIKSAYRMARGEVTIGDVVGWSPLRGYCLAFCLVL